MDHSDYSRNRHNEHLGVNKIGKNIKKSPFHQPNFANSARQQPNQPAQPQVYNINKNDFRNIVQQLTGSPSHHSQEPLLPRPPYNPPKSPSMRLQRIRPPPLSPINVNRPRMMINPAPQAQMPSLYGPRPAQYGQQPPRTMVPVPPPFGSGGNHTGWANTAESPISSYMRYLQNSINDSPQVRNHMQVQQQQSAGLLPLPYPPMAPIPSPRSNGNGPPPFLSPRLNTNGNGNGLPPLLPSPRSNGNGPPPFLSPRLNTNGNGNGLPPLLPSPRSNGNGPPPFLSPRTNTNRNGNGNGLPPLLPSPTSQFLLPSPTGYLNLSSPRSPYPLLSPGYHHPPPLTPNMPFSPMAQPGILGPGPGPGPGPQPQPPPSPRFLPVSRTKLEGFDG